MSEEAELKQQYLRSEIIDQGYDPEEFSQFLVSQKGEDACDIDNWTMSELEEIVKLFINSHNSNQNQPPNDNDIISLENQNNPQINGQINDFQQDNLTTKEEEKKVVEEEKKVVQEEKKVEEKKENATTNPKKVSTKNSAIDNGFETFSEKEISEVKNAATNLAKMSEGIEILTCFRQRRNELSENKNLSVKLSNPRIVKERLFSFSYVQLTLECPQLKTTTIRKLTDITWFREKLELMYPATYFPPLPKKGLFGEDKSHPEKELPRLNKFFDSLLQSELIRAADITRDFITLPQKDFEQQKKLVYDKCISPEQIRQFITMDGYVDIRINKKIENQVSQINNDINNKVLCYTNLCTALKSLSDAFEKVEESLKEVSVAFKNLSSAYDKKINSENIVKCFNKFTNFTAEWKNGYKDQIKYFREEMHDFFKYIYKELDNFHPLYEEFYASKLDYEGKTYTLDKNRNNPIKVDDNKKEFLNSRTVYGFILNRCYDEYYRVNAYHSKIIQKKLEEMDNSKKTLLLDYNNLINLLSIK